MAVVFERPVRFEEVDAAGLVFFARFFHYCHDAMEHFFGALPGGYVDLVMRRRVGFPAVHAEADYESPLRYGDVARIETSIAKIGTTSATFRYVLGKGGGRVHVATVSHVVVVTDMTTMKARAIPEDVRALFEAHRG